jgi:iron complex transport system ATP-binding protein
MLQAQHISVGYGTGQVVFPGISFSAQPGDMVALLGVNGIGKSTLLRTLAGLQKELAGTVLIDGKPIHDIAPVERARLVSIVLTERLYIDNITVRDFIALGRTPYTGWLGALSNEDKIQTDRVIEVMKLGSYANRFFNRLSDGEKQKILIARALCQQTPVMILDEPTAFLDFRNKREILEVLDSIARSMKKTVILSTHDIEAALMYCNKCWIMNEDKSFYEVVKGDKYKERVTEKLYGETLNS